MNSTHAKNTSRRWKRNDGIAVVWAFVITALVVTMGSTFLTALYIETSVVQNQTASLEALYVARAGISRAKAELKLDNNWSGVTSVPFASGTYSVTVTHIDPVTKSITAVGVVSEAERIVAVEIDLGDVMTPGDEDVVPYSWREL
jgi:hypothetical protein